MVRIEGLMACHLKDSGAVSLDVTHGMQGVCPVNWPGQLVSVDRILKRTSLDKPWLARAALIQQSNLTLKSIYN